jgi:nitrite reductase/ring-hydroxylating ferredoxin subunit
MPIPRSISASSSRGNDSFAFHLSPLYAVPVAKIKIARTEDVPDGKTIKFRIPGNGRPLDGFLARFQGKLIAYENRCRHLPVSLDFFDGRFFTQDGQHFVCHNHNALYEPLTGLCVQGPCEGQSLKPLPIEVADGDVWFVG